MSTANVIGKVQVALGNVKIVAVDGTTRDAAYGDLVYEGEQIVSTDPEALFQVKYSALSEATAYSGVFKVLADGSVVAGADESESAVEGDVDIFETAAGEEGIESNSQNIEDNPVANEYLQTFGRGDAFSPFPDGTGAGDVKEDGGDVFNDQPEVDDIVLGVGEDNLLYETSDGEDPQNGEDDTQDDVLSSFRGTMSVADDNAGDTHLFDVIDTDETNFTSIQDTTADGYNMHVDTLVEDDDGMADGVDDADVSVVIESTDIDASLIDVTRILLLNNDAGDRTVDFVLEGNFNALAAGETATVTFTYTALDDNPKSTEPNLSEPATVTITVTGTNDQPIVDDVFVRATESFYGEVNEKVHYGGGGEDGQGGGEDHGGGEDDPSDEYTTISGMLSAYDDDVNNTHVFNVRGYGGEDGGGEDSGPKGGEDTSFDELEYYQKGPHNDSEDILVKVHSSDIDPDLIDLTKLTLFNNNAADSQVNFELEGDFNALAAGETATITFQYIANDKEHYGKYGDWNDGVYNEASISEPKTVTITVTGTNDQPVVENIEISATETHDGWAIDNWTHTFPWFNYDHDANPTNDEFDNLIGGQLVASDEDVNDNHTFGLMDMTNPGGEDQEIFEVDYDTNGFRWGGKGTVDVLFESSAINASDIDLGRLYFWDNNGKDSDTYFSIKGDLDALGAGETATITFKYYAEDDSSGSEEPNMSEAKTVTITLHGTNDQPVIEDVEVRATESHDQRFYQDGRDNTQDDVATRIYGSLSAEDDDVTDTHYFRVIGMEPGHGGGEDHGPGEDHGGGEDGGPHGNPNHHLDTVEYHERGYNPQTAEELRVRVESTDINPRAIDVTKIILLDNDRADSTTNFVVKGDFNALGAGETATVTFQYRASDMEGFGTDGVGNNEASISEPRTVTITMYGTNDQPIIEDIHIHRAETHDSHYYQNGEDDTQDDEYNVVRGMLSAADDDVTDNHYFKVMSMGGEDRPGQNLDEVRYYENGYDSSGGERIDVRVESRDIDPSEIDVTKLVLLSNDGGDSETGFAVKGDFNALGAGETARVTFQYRASDMEGFGKYGDGNDEASISEPKTVTITICGTNDQPIVDNVAVSADEALGNRPTTVVGRLFAADDDVTDNHMFRVLSMGEDSAGGEDKELDAARYYENGVDDSGGTRVDVLVESEDVDPNAIDVTRVVLLSNDGTDSSGGFELKGDFNALGVGETATVTFKYVASDMEGFGKYGGGPNEASVSEEKTVTITVTGTNDAPFFALEGNTGLEFISESAGYANVLGIYVIDEHGNPGDPQVVMTDTNSGGDTVNPIDLEFGSFGLFVIPNGDHVPGGIENATLSFDPSDPTQLLVNGLPVTVYFDNNDWNQGGKDHFDIVSNPDGSVNITIEDLNLGDNDRNDLHIRLTPNGDSVGGVVVEMVDGAPGENDTMLTTDGTLTFDDLDLSDTHIASVSFTPDADGYIGSFNAMVDPTDPATGFGTGTINWSFDVHDMVLDPMGPYDSIVQTYTVIVTDNHGATDTQDVTITIQGTNDAPTLIATGGDYNETLTGETVVGSAVGDDVDDGAVLTYSLTGGSGMFDVKSNGDIVLKAGQSLDYEDDTSYTLDIKVTDQYGAFSTQSVVIDVNDIVGTVSGGEDTTLVSHTFTGEDNNEGWTVDPDRLDNDQAGHLGWFRMEDDDGVQTEAVVYRDFDLTGHEGEEVTISFDLKVQGSWDPDTAPAHLQDTFTTTITVNGVSAEYTGTHYDNGPAIPIEHTAIVGDDGMLRVELSGDVTGTDEKWSIDNFEITGTENQVMTFDTAHDGTIDLAELIDQANDFDMDNDGDTADDIGQTPSALSEIDLSGGDFDLSNITLDDVIELSDADNVLKITGDAGDAVHDIAANGWETDGSTVVEGATTYEVYTVDGDTSGAQLLIDIDIPIDVI